MKLTKFNYCTFLLGIFILCFCLSCSRSGKKAASEKEEIVVTQQNANDTIVEEKAVITEKIPIGTVEDTLLVTWHPDINNEQRNIINDIIKDLIFVEGGTFTMGSEDPTTYACPPHQVTVSSYYIYKFEIMQRYWYKILEIAPKTVNYYAHPICNISWYDCQLFIDKLNKLTGLKFRLPTEAEWEYAARGGKFSQNNTYSGSNSISDVAWYVNNSENIIHRVASLQPNELGLYNMSGNVWEWCYDWYAPYPDSSIKDYKGPENGSSKVYRGGSFTDSESYLRVTVRNSGFPTCILNNLGFRIVLEKQ